MKCPYCSKDMEKGALWGQRYTLRWLSETEKPSVSLFSKKGLILGNPSVFGKPKVDAYYCRNCKKVILDTSL